MEPSVHTVEISQGAWHFEQEPTEQTEVSNLMLCFLRLLLFNSKAAREEDAETRSWRPVEMVCWMRIKFCQEVPPSHAGQQTLLFKRTVH